MKYIFIVLLLLTSLKSESQYLVDGLGPLKLNNALSQVTEFLNSKYSGPEEISSEYERIRSKPTKYYKIKKGQKKEYLYPITIREYECTDAKVIYIPNLTIGEVSIKNIVLYFFQDTLCKITTDRDLTVINEGLTVKYGEPIDKREQTNTDCVFTYTGNKISKEGYSTLKTWRDDSLMMCNTYFSKYYTDKCETIYLTLFELYNKRLVAKMATCEGLIYQENKKKIEESKKGKYNEF